MTDESTSTGAVTPEMPEGAEGTLAAAGTETVERTFSQADLDRIVQERLARERQKYADYGDLKAAAGKLRDIEEANKSEVERAREKAAAAEARATAAESESREVRVRAAIVAEAARKGVVDPDAAVALMDRSQLAFDDDGTPSNVAEAMDSLLTAKPYLAGGTRASADQGARSGSKVSSQDALRLLETDPAKFDELVRKGDIPKNIFG